MHVRKLVHVAQATEELIATAIDAALQVQERAWAPYSKFFVGAALATAFGDVAIGCNVENVSFGLTQCAERAAVTAAFANGHTNVILCVVVTDAPEPTPPCGACRQVLAELGNDVLVVCRTTSGKERRFQLGELLPHAFLAIDRGT